MYREQRKGWKKFRHFLYECKIALRVTRKPEKEELKKIVIASAIGTAIIGIIGFIIQIVKEYLF